MGILSSFIGAVIGAGITWLVAHKYYVKASEELRKEASELRKLNILMLRAMEEAGLAKFNRDENGNPVGLTLKINVPDVVSTTAVTPGNLEVKRPDKT
jgi:hypothetical protein